jgi:MFS family permease
MMTSTSVLSPTVKILPSKHRLYGWGDVRFNGLLSQPWFAYIILCSCTFIQNFSVNGANNAVISTLERAFHLNSVQSGFFLALYDLATVFSAPIVGYLGDFYSSPIFFALNMIVVSMGNLLIASSHFLLTDYRTNLFTSSNRSSTLDDNVLFQCSTDWLTANNRTDTSCSKAHSLFDGSNNAKILLYLGNFVNGIGSVALFTIGIAYIERIFPREKAAYCQGIYFAVGTIGGALGIVATGRFLSLHTTLIPRRHLSHWLTTSHPLWIGCWWLPYMIYGLICFLIGLFVSGLPNYTHVNTNDSIIPSNGIIPAVSMQDPCHGRT